MTDYKKGTTNNGRIILRKKGGEEPLSARANWDLWKLCQTLTSEEITFLITKRRNDIKYESDSNAIRSLRRDILLLEDAYKIIKRKEKEEIK